MKALMNNKNFMIILFAALFVFAVGCGTTEPTDTAEEEYTSETVRGLDKITQQVINDMDAQIGQYLEVAYNPSLMDEAIERRNNMQIIASAYEIGLKEALDNGTEEQQWIAAMMLGVLNTQTQMKEIVPRLVKLTRGEDEDLRYRSLIGLMMMNKSLRYYGLDDKSVALPERNEMLYAIATNLSNPDYALIRSTAAMALGFALNTDEKKDILNGLILRLSEETDVQAKIAVIFALAEIGADEGIEAIASLAMNDDEPSIRLEAVVSIGQSLRKEYIPLLIKKLDDKEATIRAQTIMILKGFRNLKEKRKEIATAIQQLLNDSDYKVRSWAALALGDLGEKHVIPRLIAKLGDRELKVQLAAVDALGKLADESAIEPLIKAMASKDEELRSSCREALKRITGADWGESVLEWQQWFEQGMPPVSPENKANVNPENQTNDN